jgi:hypothetical protein
MMFQGGNRRGVSAAQSLFLLFVAIFVLADSASAAIPVRISAPGNEALIKSSRFKLEIRTGTGVSRPRVEIAGKNVSGKVRRQGPRKWNGVFSRSILRPGANEISVLVRTGNRRGFAVSKVFKGEARKSFVTVTAPRTVRSSLPVRIGLKGEIDLFLRARLNGKKAYDALQPEFGRTRKARLSPSYGLRFGTNRLAVSAARSDGVFDAETRKIFVPRFKPLAGAGRDRLVRRTGKVILNGASSLRSRKGTKLTYRWSIAGKPARSGAALKDRGSVRPRLVLDRPGVYNVRLKVTEKGRGFARSDQDTVRVVSGPGIPPIGLPLNTLGNPSGSNPGISYAGQFYPANFSENSVQAMVIDRNSGLVTYSETFAGTAADAQTLTNEIKGVSPSKPLVILSISGFGPNVPDPAFNQVIKSLSGSTVPGNVLSQDGVSVIGIPGSPQAAWTNGGWTAEDLNDLQDLPGALNGYLQIDNTGHLSFVPGARFALDSSAPGGPANQNLISIGENNFPSGPLVSPSDPNDSCGTGGFQIQAVDVEYLRPGPGDTFTTNGCGAGEDVLGQGQMAQFIKNDLFPDNVASQLVVIQSIGNPRGPNDGGWGQLAEAIAGLGGNPFLFNGISSTAKSYALLTGASGSASPLPDFSVVESSERATGSPAHLTAVLKQGRTGFVQPNEASPTSSTYDFDLSLLAYSSAGGDPFPNTTGAGNKAALKYIADEVLQLPPPTEGVSCYVPPQPDIRSEYCNPNVRDRWASEDADGYTQKLTNATYPGTGAGFSLTTWNQLRCDFIGLDCSGPGPQDEWGEIDQVWSDFETLGNFILSSNSDALTDANQTAQNVRSSITANQGSLLGTWYDVWADLLAGASYVVPDDAQAPVGLLSTVGYLAADWVNASTGDPLLTKFNEKAALYLSDLSATLTNSFSALVQTRNLILTDAEKLHTMANGDFVPGNLESTLPAFTLGIGRFSYQTLLPAAYGPVKLERIGENVGVTNAREYLCGAADLEVTYYPFPNEPDSGQWNPPGGHLWALYLNGDALPDGLSRIRPSTPDATLMDPLFKPYATDSTGVIPTQFAFDPDVFFPTTWDLSKAPVLQC